MGDRQRYSRASSCDGKHRYGEAHARRTARIMGRETGETLHAYPCRYCRSWHIGHVPLRRMKSEKRKL